MLGQICCPPPRPPARPPTCPPARAPSYLEPGGAPPRCTWSTAEVLGCHADVTVGADLLHRRPVQDGRAAHGVVGGLGARAGVEEGGAVLAEGRVGRERLDAQAAPSPGGVEAGRDTAATVSGR